MANVGSWQPDRLDTIHYIHKLAEERVGEGYSVISGCDVNEKGTPDMDVVVDSGSVYFNNVITAVAGNNVTISAADGTHDRIDVIYVDTSGVAQVHTGDALVKSDPLGNTVWTQYEQPYPKTGCPSGTIIALVYVPANDTAIGNVQIEDVAQYNIRKHAIDSTVEHDGVSGATENNFVSFDGSGLPKDSGHKDADYEDAGTMTTHQSTYTHSLIADHDSRHITGGSDEIDGDKLDIDYTPTNYTPSTTPGEASNIDNLTAHLYGIDQELATSTLQATVFGTVLPENTAIILDPALSADGKYSGIAITGIAGTTLAFGDVIYLAVADSRWELAKADAATTSKGILGICILAAESDGDTTTILISGKIRADAAFPTLTVGDKVYLSDATAGDVVATAPSQAENHVVRILGHALTANEMRFDPDDTYLEYEAA